MIEEPQKKMVLIALTVVAIIAGSLLVFVIFFNRGKLILVGKSPYIVEIPNVKTITCLSDQCEISLIPNKYQISIQKDQFESQKLDVKVPLGGQSTYQLTFNFIPSAQIIADLSQILNDGGAAPYQKYFSDIQLKNWPIKPLQFADLPTTYKSFKISPDATTAMVDNGQNVILYNFSTQQAQLLNITSGQNIFYDEESKNIFYIDLDAKTTHQTLYRRALNNLNNPIALTTFPRALKNYQLFPSPDSQKILLLDSNTNTVYLIDTQQKTRTAIYSQPLITNLKWLPENDGFLIEGQANSAQTTAKNQLTWFDLKTAKAQQVNITESLKNIVPQANHQLILASTIDSGFINYNLENGLITQLFQLGEITFPTRTEASTKPNQILFQSQNSLYQLTLSPES